MNTAALRPSALRGEAAARALSTGVWAFIGVGSALFTLFLAAYVMRMEGADWTPIAMPWQLWLSSAVLVAGSVLMQRAGTVARARRWPRARALLLAGGVCAAAFIGSQLWGWNSLLDARVALAGNPAASFFYLLTALHGVHVLGGLVAWGAAAASAAEPADASRVALRITLCARYWHFLLAVWAVLFATFGWLTPDVVAFICGRG